MEQYHVRISKDDLVFSAAHFITLDRNVCERLHGHDYRVAAEVHGPLDENHYVVDFIALGDVLRAILDELDHRVLEDRRWVFPRSDCLLLPIPSTTAELLARYIGRRLLDALEARFGTRPARVRIEVHESRGLSAVCELRD